MHLRRRSSVKSAPSSACIDKPSRRTADGRLRLSKNLVEFRRARRNKKRIGFVWRRVRQTKHKTPGKCGICAQTAHKLCAQPGAAFSNANPASRFAFESLSKRLFDKLSRGATAPLLFHFPRTAKNGRSERKFQKTVAVLRKIWYTDKLDRHLARRDEARCGLTAFTATPDSRSG